jgi:hypothetical protein
MPKIYLLPSKIGKQFLGYPSHMGYEDNNLRLLDGTNMFKNPPPVRVRIKRILVLLGIALCKTKQN